MELFRQCTTSRFEAGPATSVRLVWSDRATCEVRVAAEIDPSMIGSPGFLSLSAAAVKSIEGVAATIDHPDMRGSRPHEHDPSGAASV